MYMEEYIRAFNEQVSQIENNNPLFFAFKGPVIIHRVGAGANPGTGRQ